MQFTPNDVFAAARDRAMKIRDVTLDPQQMARIFNRNLRMAVQKIVQVDPERIAEEVIVSNADTTASTDNVDLTASGTRDWLQIDHVDFRTSATGTYDDQLILGSIEARHRIQSEFAHFTSPTGYWYDKLRKIKKVSGWSGVYDLRIYGTVKPTEIDWRNPSQDFTTVFDYPEPLVRFMEGSFLFDVAPRLAPNEIELAAWKEDRDEAFGDMLDDAKMHVSDGARIEDIPHRDFWSH